MHGMHMAHHCVFEALVDVQWVHVPPNGLSVCGVFLEVVQ